MNVIDIETGFQEKIDKDIRIEPTGLDARQLPADTDPPDRPACP